MKCFFEGDLHAEVTRQCHTFYKDPVVSSTVRGILAVSERTLNDITFEFNLANNALKTIPAARIDTTSQAAR